MNIKSMEILGTGELYDAKNMIDECNCEHYIGNLEEYDFYELAYDNGRLIGLLVCEEYESCEVRGVVRSEYRRQGIFKQMVELLPDGKKSFVGKDNFEEFSEVAGRFGFKNIYHEYLMQYGGSRCELSDDSDMEYEEDEGIYYFFIGEEQIGSLATYRDGRTVSVAEVFLEEKWRGRGISKQMMDIVLSEIYNEGIDIVLQVSEKNIPALKLYKRCGFVIKDSIFYANDEG